MRCFVGIANKFPVVEPDAESDQRGEQCGENKAVHGSGSWGNTTSVPFAGYG